MKKYVIKHAFDALLTRNTWFILIIAVFLHRDFFIVLDLRLTKRLVVCREASYLSSFIEIAIWQFFFVSASNEIYILRLN
jgi:hypothetical protein